MITTVVAGNPKPGSRTLDAATKLVESLTGAAADHIVDVIELGPGLLGWGDEKIEAAVETVGSPDLLLKPVLVELGAVCPLPGLYLIDSTYTTDTRIADYTDRWASALRRV
ncbi:hypothetical protein IA539_20385 [Gordonia sp. zg691]|uniref:hypothetical protein n=1 Tax=Gordonia jinghuaiqii TaxID=2758710 RepID=UPI0016623F24|nr:hypothetical protein [Gordonia jinghuaiqii]MBD0863537.1 hypothetical protein [Gordonia jinghuaiqii]